MKTLEELRKLAIDGRIYEKAHDDLGIYPQTNTDDKGSFIPRTEWQNGWNDAVMEHTRNAILYYKFMETLTEEHRVALENLLLDDVIYLHKGKEDKVYLWLNVNDIFYLAADMEDVLPEDLPLLASLQERYGFGGILAWVAKKRNMEPIAFKYKKTNNYIAAETELNNGVKKDKSFIQKVRSFCGL